MKQLQESRGVVCRTFVANLLVAKNMLLMCGTTSRIRGAVLVSKREFDSFVISFVIFFYRRKALKRHPREEGALWLIDFTQQYR